MHLGLRFKVLLTVSLSLLIIFGLTMFLLVSNTTSHLKNSLNEESKSFASLATTPIGNTFLLYQNSGTIKITQQVNSFLTLDPDITSVQIVSTDGTQQYNSNSSANTQVSSRNAATFDPIYKSSSKGYLSEIIEPVIEATGVHRYAIVYDISSKRVEQNVTDVVDLIFYIGIVVLLIVLVSTGLLLNRIFIKPLRDVSRSANIISTGHYDHEIISKSHDEIGDLAASVNKMAVSLKADITKFKDLDELKSEFLMIASHNLRTPISTILAYLEISETTNTAEELKAIISNINDSVGRLNSLAEDILTIAALEAGGTFKSAPIKIYPFINSLISEVRPIAKKKLLKINLENSVPKDLTLSLQEANIHSAFSGVIDNAIKFTLAKGEINVNAKVSDETLIITVNDNGIGIRPEELSKLFTKFHRGTSTLTYDYPGEGLGLYLSKLIIDQHHGNINVVSKPDNGTTVTIKLPLAAAQVSDKKAVQLNI